MAKSTKEETFEEIYRHPTDRAAADFLGPVESPRKKKIQPGCRSLNSHLKRVMIPFDFT